jgi:ecotin
LTRAFLIGLLSACAAVAAAAGDPDPLAPFRDPDPDERRYAIQLDSRLDDASIQVELLIGKNLSVDCNPKRFVGKFSTKKVIRRGYVYYTARDIHVPVTTPVVCPEDSLPHQALVYLDGGPYWVPYSSKVPIVVYVPAGFEVRYRLWTAEATMREAEQK